MRAYGDVAYDRCHGSRHTREQVPYQREPNKAADANAYIAKPLPNTKADNPWRVLQVRSCVGRRSRTCRLVAKLRIR